MTVNENCQPVAVGIALPKVGNSATFPITEGSTHDLNENCALHSGSIVKHEATFFGELVDCNIAHGKATGYWELAAPQGATTNIVCGRHVLPHLHEVAFLLHFTINFNNLLCYFL